jgi:FixJ family two-component response regulator
MNTKDNITQETQDNNTQELEQWLASLTPKERSVANAVRKLVCDASRSHLVDVRIVRGHLCAKLVCSLNQVPVKRERNGRPTRGRWTN